jgi:hypothetical protein
MMQNHYATDRRSLTVSGGTDTMRRVELEGVGS